MVMAWAGRGVYLNFRPQVEEREETAMITEDRRQVIIKLYSSSFFFNISKRTSTAKFLNYNQYYIFMYFFIYIYFFIVDPFLWRTQ